MIYSKFIAAITIFAAFTLYAAESIPTIEAAAVSGTLSPYGYGIYSDTQTTIAANTVHGYRTVQPSVSSSGQSCCPSPCQNNGYPNSYQSNCCQGSYQSDCCPAPCQANCCSWCLPQWCGTFDVEVDALYWRICGDGELFAITETDISNVNTNLNFHRVRPDNEWGVKALARYTSCDGCKFVSLSYLYFDETDRSSVLNPTDVSYLQDNINPLSFVKAKRCHEYQRLDARAGYYLCQGCCGAFYSYGGVSWIYFKSNDRMEGVQTAAQEQLLSFRQSGRYSAAGFEVGLGGRYIIGCGFGLSAEFGGIAAIGERCNRFEIFSLDDLEPDATFSNHPSSTVCLPGLDLKLEAFYERMCGCFKLGVGVGYEQQYYFDALRSNRLYFGNANTLSPAQFSESRNIGFGGLTISGRIGY